MANSEAKALADALVRNPKAWTWHQLLSRWSRSAVNGALRRGHITRILPGIYSATEHANSLLVRAHAAQLWCGPDSVVIGEGAAAVWELCDVPQEICVATPYGVSRDCPPWLSLRRLAVAVPNAMWGPCQVAMPEWAAITAYAATPARVRDAFLYRAVQSGRAQPADLLRVAAALPRLKGRSHLLQVIAAMEDGAESHLETAGLRRVFNTADFADFVRQHWIRTPAGSYRLDMFHPASRTAVELDGKAPHDGSDRRQYDITRDANVARLGILTVRLSAKDVYDRAAWCREVVKAVIDGRV